MSSPLFLLLLATLFFSGIPSSQAVEPKVENFALIDQKGKFHEFDYYRRNPKTKGVVLFIQGNGCPLVRKRIPELKRLKASFQPQGILFGMLNANSQDERDDILEEAREFGIEMPILKDSSQLVAGMLNVTRTAEALLIDTKTRKIIFRGPIDDGMSYQSGKASPSNQYLKKALNSFLNGEEISEPKIEAPGCLITFEDTGEQEITYARDVAPILKRRCVECHTKGGVGPFAMSSHKKVDGWSDMMAEMILTKQMPPWHADPHIGKFSNASALSDEEAKTIVSWIRNGSPRGEGPDPLAGYQPDLPEWTLGDPDHIISLPKQEIPDEGVLEYRYAYIPSPFDRDVWIGAAEVKPGNLKVLHHAIATIENQSEKRKRNISGRWIGGYAPGTDPSPYPAGTGVLLKKNERIKVELHYTVSGRPDEKDITRIGLHLLDQPPAKTFETGIIVYRGFEIEPFQSEYIPKVIKVIKDPKHPKDPKKATKIKTDIPYERVMAIPHDIILYGLNPHMHFRGKRMSFAIRKADGSEDPILSVPNYNFNWQRTYQLDEPLRISAGSKLVVRNAWDNSPQNPFNPDPSKTVRWGDQTFEEMFFAIFTYVKAN